MGNYPPQGSIKGGVPSPEPGIPEVIPNLIKPIHIAANLEHQWLHDQFFYTTLSALMDHGYLSEGSGSENFDNLNGRLEFVTTNSSGSTSEIRTRQGFRLKNPLLKDDIYWRAIANVQNNAGGDVRFGYIGLVDASPNGNTLIANALNAMGNSIAFFSSEGQSGNNWTCMTQDGGVRTVTNTTVNARVKAALECRVNQDSDIEFLINDVIVATHSANIPFGDSINFRIGMLALSNDIERMDLFGMSVATTKVQP